MASTTLSPTIDDDGWSGSLTYLWEQLTGVAATIDTPTAASTLVTFAGTGRHTFKLTVSNDEFSSTALFLVYVVGDVEETPEDTSVVTVTGTGGREIDTLLDTASIETVLNETPHRMRFTVYGRQVEVGEHIIVTQSGRRLFAGNVIEVSGAKVESGT